MNATPLPFVNLAPDGRSAARVTKQLLVLACALPRVHDEGSKRSRELAQKFCDDVHQAATAAAIDVQRLADLSTDLLGSKEWSGWHVSFCIAEHRVGSIKAFNCGVTSLFWSSHRALHGPLLAPQTVGRRLRSEGVTDIPPHVAYIGATMASADMIPANIEVAELEATLASPMVALADPRIADMLPEVAFADGLSVETLTNAIEALQNSLNNPERSFLLWWPAEPRT
jgi:hypothetical protein